MLPPSALRPAHLPAGRIPFPVRRALARLLLLVLPIALAACAPLPAPRSSGTPATAVSATVPVPAQEISLAPDDRILILAPHPDDETLGAGGIIQKAESMGLPVRVAYLTNGDANQWSFMLYRKRPELGARAVESLGEVRRSEAISATLTLGLKRDQLVFLGYPDFGTLQIWDRHWGDAPPYRGLLTGATAVPYPDAYRPGAAYRAQEVLHDIQAVIGEFKPTKIFVSHPADQNPDHLALYLFTRVALWDLAGEIQPQLYPYLVHYPNWPETRGYDPGAPLAPPADLAEDGKWVSEPLTSAEVQVKHDALRQHKTQYEANKRYLESFLRSNELFGDMAAVPLLPGAAGASFSRQSLLGGNRGGEQLTEEERAKFVGLESRTVRLEGTDLVFTIGFTNPLAQGTEASVYLFGYRSGAAFEGMPKLHVKFSDIAYQVYDGQNELPSTAVSVTRAPGQISLRVPLALLGDPRRVLFNARTYLGNVPLDSTEWRVLNLPDDTS
jgi:LmbE family N-acetylglucosaminyl deacetylase